MPAPLTESSLALLERAQAGDREALEELLVRYRPRLKRWAHRRLPSWARDLADTDDLVQNTLIRTVKNLAQFSAAHPMAIQEYLRTAMANAVRDEIRRASRRPGFEDLGSSIESPGSTPLQQAMDGQRLARYESALHQLCTEDREAVIARLEFGFTHVELAAALGKRTPDAARKITRRALSRLLDLMQQAQGDQPHGPGQ